MEKLSLILGLLLALSFSALAQDALYVVDGQVSNAKIKPADILTVSILDSARAIELYKHDYKSGVTVIITKQFAISQYQQKFSSLNRRYKEYIDQKHTDENLAYVLDNNILNTEHKSAIQQLYELSPGDIDKIAFKKDSHFTTDATVVITTKK